MQENLHNSKKSSTFVLKLRECALARIVRAQNYNVELRNGQIRIYHRSEPRL